MDDTRRMRPLLGTFVEVSARGTDTAVAIERAFEAIAEAQALWSFQDERSELSRLNGAPGTRVRLQAGTLRLLRIAKAFMLLSHHAFDCTVGGLLVGKGALPDHGGPAPLPRGCAQDLELGDTWARLRRPVRLTLDGVAKGYAVDLAIRALRCHGASAGWVNAGGDLRVFGDVTLPVQRRELDGQLTSLGGLRDAALASSRASHSWHRDDPFQACIVAPEGLTPETGIWSVLARSAWRADALTKVASATAPAQRQALVQRLGGCLVTPPSLDMPA